MNGELSHTAAAPPQPGKPSSKRRPLPGDFGLSLCPFSAEEINSWLFDVSLALVRAGYGYPRIFGLVADWTPCAPRPIPGVELFEAVRAARVVLAGGAEEERKPDLNHE